MEYEFLNIHEDERQCDEKIKYRNLMIDVFFETKNAYWSADYDVDSDGNVTNRDRDLYKESGDIRGELIDFSSEKIEDIIQICWDDYQRKRRRSLEEYIRFKGDALVKADMSAIFIKKAKKTGEQYRNFFNAIKETNQQIIDAKASSIDYLAASDEKEVNEMIWYLDLTSEVVKKIKKESLLKIANDVLSKDAYILTAGATDSETLLKMIKGVKKRGYIKDTRIFLNNIDKTLLNRAILREIYVLGWEYMNPTKSMLEGYAKNNGYDGRYCC